MGRKDKGDPRAGSPLLSLGAIRFGSSGPAPPDSSRGARFDLRGVALPVQPGSTCVEWLCLCSPVRPVGFPGSACAIGFGSSGPAPPGPPVGPRFGLRGGALPVQGSARPGPIRVYPGSARLCPDPALPNPDQLSPIRPNPGLFRPSPARPGDVPSSMARPGCGGRPRRRSRPLPDGRVGWGCNEKADLPKGKSALFRFPKALTRSAE